MQFNSLLYYFLVLLFMVHNSNGFFSHYQFHDDERNLIQIENPFGFLPGGSIEVIIADLSLQTPSIVTNHSTTIAGGGRGQVDGGNGTNTKPSKIEYSMGLLLRYAKSRKEAQQDYQAIVQTTEDSNKRTINYHNTDNCIFNKLSSKDVFLKLSEKKYWKKSSLHLQITSKNQGFYSLFFIRCLPTDLLLTSFQVNATFLNPGPSYLSAEEAALPMIYLIYFCLYTITLGVWIWILQRNPQQHGSIHRIHHLMWLLLTCKVFSLLFKSMHYHALAVSERKEERWLQLYYIFIALQGFVAIGLITTGYTILKKYLTSRDRMVLALVGSLQIIDIVARIILDLIALSTSHLLFSWPNFLQIVDPVYCIVLLFPIVFPFQNLRHAAEVNVKVQQSLVKLQLFRTFYVIVVVYIYFTRITGYLLAAMVPDSLLWVGDVSTETATFIFFVLTGYMFRPTIDNPYDVVATNDEEEKEPENEADVTNAIETSIELPPVHNGKPVTVV